MDEAQVPGEVEAVRRSAWSPRACAVCDEAHDLKPLSVETFQVKTRGPRFELITDLVACNRCGFTFARQVPDDEFLFDYYSQAFTRDSEYADVAPDYNADPRMAAVQQFLEPGSTILEVGANAGEFCAKLRASGFRADGLDPLAQTGDADIDQAFVSAGQPAAHGEVDAVASYYVLEHVTDPMAWLLHLRAALRTGGILITEVPDFHTHPSISMHREHFLHFSPRHLEWFLARAGFETLHSSHEHASRDFGFLNVSRLVDAKASPEGSFRPPSQEAPSLVAQAVASYEVAQQVRKQEKHAAEKAAAAALELAGSAGTIVFWPANAVASRIALAMPAQADRRIHVVDSATSKIGRTWDGFTKPIAPPRFTDGARLVFVLCSPEWNPEIKAQVEAAELGDVAFVEAV